MTWCGSGCGLKIENPLTWAWHRFLLLSSFSSKKDGFNESKMDSVSKIPNCIFLTSLKSIRICNIQITLRHTFWAFFFVMFFFQKLSNSCWVKPWQTLAASMVPLFIGSLALAVMVVMVGGECLDNLDTSMLQTQLLVHKRTPPLLHPWEVNNYIMVSWPAQPGICFPWEVKSLRFVVDTFLFVQVKSPYYMIDIHV